MVDYSKMSTSKLEKLLEIAERDYDCTYELLREKFNIKKDIEDELKNRKIISFRKKGVKHE